MSSRHFTPKQQLDTARRVLIDAAIELVRNFEETIPGRGTIRFDLEDRYVQKDLRAIAEATLNYTAACLRAERHDIEEV